MIKSAITIILVSFCVISYGQETKSFKKDNISFEYPIEWVTRDFPGYYILVSEPPKEQLSVMTTFDIAVEDGHQSLNKYCEDYENKISNNEQFLEFKIKHKKEIVFKSMPAVEYHCTATVQNLPIEWKSIVFFKYGKVYKLSTTSMIGQFYLQKDNTDKIFDSFKIKLKTSS